MKKFLSVMLLVAAIVFIGNPQAQAYERRVGTYSDGSPVFLLTETVNIRSYSPYRFTCTVRAGRDYLDYSFYPYNGSPYYRNNEGYSGYVFGGASPVAANIYRFVTSNY